MSLKGFKSKFGSKGVWGSVLALLAVIGSLFKLDFDVNILTELPAVLGIVAVSFSNYYTRIKQTVSGFNPVSLTTLAVNLAIGVGVAFGVEDGVLDALKENMMIIAGIVFNLLSSFGIYKAKKLIA